MSYKPVYQQDENPEAVDRSPSASRDWSWQLGWQLPTPAASMLYGGLDWPPRSHPASYPFPPPTLPTGDLQRLVEDAVQLVVQAALPSLPEGPQQPLASTAASNPGPTPTNMDSPLTTLKSGPVTTAIATTMFGVATGLAVTNGELTGV